MTFVQENNPQQGSLQEQNTPIIRRFCKEVYNQGREDVLDEIISSDSLDYGHNPSGRGIEGAKADFRSEQRIFSNVYFTIDDLIALGAQAVVRWTGSLVLNGVESQGQTYSYRSNSSLADLLNNG
jgi:hypothetical protein